MASLENSSIMSIMMKGNREEKNQITSQKESGYAQWCADFFSWSWSTLMEKKPKNNKKGRSLTRERFHWNLVIP